MEAPPSSKLLHFHHHPLFNSYSQALLPDFSDPPPLFPSRISIHQHPWLLQTSPHPHTASQQISDAKALAASRSHSEAERRRRERINTHLATLRSLLPSPTKTDKASLLAEVIDHVKCLKKQAADVAGGPLPTDVDELSVALDLSRGEGGLAIRASICCDDRPDLFSDFTETLETLGLKTVRAEIATLAGRVKNELIMTRREDCKDTKESSPSVSRVQEALKAVLERSTSQVLSPQCSSGNKRQRISQLEMSSPDRSF